MFQVVARLVDIKDVCGFSHHSHDFEPHCTNMHTHRARSQIVVPLQHVLPVTHDTAL